MHHTFTLNLFATRLSAYHWLFLGRFKKKYEGQYFSLRNMLSTDGKLKYILTKIVCCMTQKNSEGVIFIVSRDFSEEVRCDLVLGKNNLHVQK